MTNIFRLIQWSMIFALNKAFIDTLRLRYLIRFRFSSFSDSDSPSDCVKGLQKLSYTFMHIILKEKLISLKYYFEQPMQIITSEAIKIKWMKNFNILNLIIFRNKIFPLHSYYFSAKNLGSWSEINGFFQQIKHKTYL